MCPSKLTTHQTVVDAPAEPSATTRLLDLMGISDPVSDISEGLKGLVDAALQPRIGAWEKTPPVSALETYRLAGSTPEDLRPLCRAASLIRDAGRGRTVSFSPKVFIPLTRLCRDFCGYCTFRQAPHETKALYMSPDEVLAVAKAGERLGCTEALLTLGERPEQRYPEAGEWLRGRGYNTTLDYLYDVCRLVLENTSLMPHLNPGTMSRREMKHLREVSASMGVMLENASPRLSKQGGPHEFAPSKRPTVRLKTFELAGELKVAFTTGILIGIGETREERIESILAIRDLHERHGHIQEVIIQNFRAKPATPMHDYIDPSTEDLLWTVAVARLILGPDMNIQVPPNLSYSDYPLYLMAGINDWGGISPLTIDYVNPEAPWPQISDLQRRTEELGFTLRPRLPVYPEFITSTDGFIPTPLDTHIRALADNEGYVKGGIERYVGASC